MEASDPNLVRTLLFILLSLILVAFNGFFVAAEFAIVKVRRTRLKELEGKGNLLKKGILQRKKLLIALSGIVILAMALFTYFNFLNKLGI